MAFMVAVPCMGTVRWIGRMSTAKPPAQRKRKHSPAASYPVWMFDRAELAARKVRSAQHKADMVTVDDTRGMTQRERNALIKRQAAERQNVYEAALADAARVLIRQIDVDPSILEKPVGTPATPLRRRNGFDARYDHGEEVQD
jgi:hypothetical protein